MIPFALPSEESTATSCAKHYMSVRSNNAKVSEESSNPSEMENGGRATTEELVL